MIFAENWWLRAATGDQLDLIKREARGASASLPVFRTRKLGLSVIAPPPFTRLFEPTIDCTSDARALSAERAASVLRECLAELNGYKRIEFVLRPDTNLTPSFAVSGFSIQDEVTFSSREPASCERLLAQMHPKLRSTLRGARRSCVIERHTDVERFISVARSDFNGEDRNDYGALRRLWSGVAARGAGLILSATNDCGFDVASAVIVWDQRCLYYLLSARSPKHPSRGGNSLLIWSAIETAEKAGLVFDMDGSHSPSALQFDSQFGLFATARKRVFRNSVSWKIAEIGRDLFRKIIPAGHFRRTPRFPDIGELDVIRDRLRQGAGN